MLIALYSVTAGPDATRLVKQAVPVVPQPNQSFTPQVLNWQQADPALSNNWALANQDYLFAWNSGESVQTARVVSAPESVFGRFGDITTTIQPGQISILGPVVKAGFGQLDGNCYVVSSSTDIYLNPFVFV